tara:strand:- start:40422 stop:41876 length:1455 start_codon:yes stop_codon:yes gene_type:complete
MTNAKPKCLVATAGKPILQYQIDAYRNAGIDELLIVVGYEGQAIREYCKHIKGLSITIIDNVDYEITNNMYSLYLAKEMAKGRGFILNNADLSIDSSIVKKLVEHDSDDAIAVDTSVFDDESMKVTVDGDGYITDISKAIKEADAFACSIDFYKFSAASSAIFFAEIGRIVEHEENRKDWTEVAMQRLFRSRGLLFRPCDIAGLDWVEIDNYFDLSRSDRLFSKFDERMKGVDNVILDLDGTVYVGDTMVPGAGTAIEALQDSGRNVYFLSNNSSKTKQDYVERLKILGIHCDQSKITLSTDALIDYLLREKVENVHVLGTKSLKKTFIDNGFCIDSVTPEYVVIGYDTELNYQKLVVACQYINKGTDILATHCDIFCPTEIGPIPDIGALLEMIKQTTGRAPKKVFGKPSIEMILPLFANNKLDPARTLIVGDRLHTDILMAKNIPCLGLLVLSGETSRDALETSDIKPDFVLDSLGDISCCI